MDVEGDKKSQGVFSKIPRAVPFILFSIFFERYTSGGIAGKNRNELSQINF